MFSKVIITNNVVSPFYGSQCIY